MPGTPDLIDLVFAEDVGHPVIEASPNERVCRGADLDEVCLGPVFRLFWLAVIEQVRVDGEEGTV